MNIRQSSLHSSVVLSDIAILAWRVMESYAFSLFLSTKLTCWYDMKDTWSSMLLVSNHIIRPAQQRTKIHMGLRGVTATQG